ncbi:hypothetical protein CSB45_01705 [candidate division KSB3 bacterium]|uniref:Membrane protein 6-pyruvoyl-tetrahydropterin synthase-related domain-containing protein n=1 Tax=candidate division KSB3 bacterium TaxID=2044937 RepID=A0A2G6EAM1_9BACT|nr:MAG: hypothetical protein CSB45_01705 [candidate division KSB3 bacterium]PIE30695.1 MAG: hypothetical protein CSA57_01645 [candidate division KSB3 bacterium]
MALKCTRIWREKALWLLLFIIALCFLGPLFKGEIFFVRDIYKLFLPQKRLLQEFWAAGEWPFWDRYLHGGQPYLASLTNAAVYPLNLLYLVFPLLTAFNLNVALHFFLCAASAYLFVRVLGFSTSASIIVGIAYSSCGLSLSQVNLVHTFFSAAYLPLLFLCWHLFLSENKQRWFVLAVMINVLRLLLGASEHYIIGALLLAGWTFGYPYPLRRALSKGLLWGLLHVFAFGIAAIQLVPAIEMVSQSSRGEGLQYYTFSFWSLSPRRFPELLLPHFSGWVDRLGASDYWARSIDDDTPMTLILSIYWGLPLLFLGFSGGLSARRDRLLPRRVRRFLLATIWLSFLLAAGRYLPMFELIHRSVPLIGTFRFPVKSLWLGIFPMALLAGYAVDCHWGQNRETQGQWRPSKRLLSAMWICSACLAVCVILWWLSPGFSAAFHRFFFLQQEQEVSLHGLRQSFLHAFGIWTLLTLVYHYHSQLKQKWLALLLCGIILLDLMLAGKALLPGMPKELYTETPPVVERIKRVLGDGRLYRTKTPRNPVLLVPENHIVWGTRWNLEILTEYNAASYNIPVIFHEDFDRLANFREVAFRRLLERTAWQQKIPLLSAAGVSVILTDEKFSGPGIEYLGTVPNHSNLVFHLYKNSRYLGKARFVGSWEYVESTEAAEAAMLADRFDPNVHVVLEAEDARSKHFCFRGRGRPKPVPPPVHTGHVECSGAAEIQEVSAGSSSLTFSVTSACDGYLVLQQPFYPGWQLRLDGKPVPILRANLAFSAAFVPRGTHVLHVFYAPVSHTLGLGLSFFFLLSLFLCVCLKIFQRVGRTRLPGQQAL